MRTAGMPARPRSRRSSYDFYDMLPKFEVVVPEKEKDVRPGHPRGTGNAPRHLCPAGGFLQEFRRRGPRACAARAAGRRVQGAESSVDNDTWHRIRIGPISKLDELNRLRTILRKADVDVLVIRVGD